MTSPQIVSSILATILALAILYLVRRDHLAPNQAIRWFIVALLALLLGFFPSIVDAVGISLGISYPPIIPILIAIVALIVKIMVMDIQLNKAKITQERMIQKIAMLEADLNMLNNKLNAQQNDHSEKVDEE